MTRAADSRLRRSARAELRPFECDEIDDVELGLAADSLARRVEIEAKYSGSGSFELLGTAPRIATLTRKSLPASGSRPRPFRWVLTLAYR